MVAKALRVLPIMAAVCLGAGCAAPACRPVTAPASASAGHPVALSARLLDAGSVPPGFTVYVAAKSKSETEEKSAPPGAPCADSATAAFQRFQATGV